MVVNDDVGNQAARGACEPIASMLAPTGGWLGRMYFDGQFVFGEIDVLALVNVAEE